MPRQDARPSWGKKEIIVSSQETINDESLLLTYSRFHHHYHSTFPGKIRDLGCTTAHICYVAMGCAEAVIIANESYEDLASARVIIEAAGGGYHCQGYELLLLPLTSDLKSRPRPNTFWTTLLGLLPCSRIPAQ